MKQYKPNFTAKKAKQLIFKMIKKTTNAMYKDTFDIVLENFLEVDDETALLMVIHSQVHEQYSNELSDFITEIIEFVGSYLSFGVSSEIKDNLINIANQTAVFTANKVKDMLQMQFITTNTENKNDKLEVLKKFKKELENVIYIHVTNRLLVIIRHVLFMTYIAIVENTKKKLYVDWLPVLHDEFKHPICKERKKLFKATDFEIVMNLYFDNAQKYKNKPLFEEGYTFLAPHYLCDGMFLARR